MDNQIGGLEKLIIKGVYEAEFLELASRLSKYDNLPDPLVRVFGPNPNIRYHGFVVYSLARNPHIKTEANKIRERLIKEGHRAGRVRVMVVGEPKNVDEPYILVATNALLTFKKEVYPFTLEEAFSALKGTNVFYARVTSFTRIEQPCLTAYNIDGDKLHGFFELPEEYDEQAKAECIVGRDLINGKKSRGIRGIRAGDYIIVRLVRDNKKGTLFFQPLINFFTSDEAYSPDGRRLLTRITGYEMNDFIYDLPITSTSQTKRGKLVGFGHVKRPEEEQGIYYKPMMVRGADKDKGRYIANARVICNTDTVVVAEKI